VPRILIANLPYFFIKEEPLQAQKRPNHVFADSLCLSFGLSPDLAVDVETCVVPMETTDTVEGTIRGCAPFGNQYMDMGMEIDAITEGLDHRTEIAVLLLEPILIFSKEPLKIIKEYPIKNRMFRMPLVVDSCHGREDEKM